MRKFTLFTGLLVVPALVYVAASHFQGKEIQERLEKEVTYLNSYLNDELQQKHLSIELVPEKTGSFSSQYTFNLKTNNETLFTLKSDIEHGPFPLSLLKQGRFSPVLYHSQSFLSNNMLNVFKETSDTITLTSEKPVYIEYTQSYKKEFNGKIVVSPFNLTFLNDTVRSDQHTIRFNTNADFTQNHTEIDMGAIALNASSRNNTFTFKPGKIVYTQEKKANNTSSQTHASFDGLSLSEHDITIDFEKLSGVRRVDNDGQFINYSEQSTTEHLRVNNTDLGQLSSALSLEKLDASAVQSVEESFVDFLKKLIQSFSPNSKMSSKDREALAYPLMLNLYANANKILKHQPIIVYGPIEHKNTAGSLKFTASAKTSSIQPGLSEDPLAYLSAANLEIQGNEQWLAQLIFDVFSLAKENDPPTPEKKQALIEILKAYKKALIEAELVTQEGEDLRLSLNVQADEGKALNTNAIIDFNGQRYPLEAFDSMIEKRFQKFDDIVEQSDLETKLDEWME